MIEVILLERIVNLGNLGERIRVKPGYARNYLIPYGKAVTATPQKIAEFEQRRADLEKLAAERLEQAKVRAEALQQVQVTISAKAGEEGKLFGSVSARDVVEAYAAQGVSVERHEVHLPQGPLRFVGEHVIQIQLHPEVLLDVTVQVNPE